MALQPLEDLLLEGALQVGVAVEGPKVEEHAAVEYVFGSGGGKPAFQHLRPTAEASPPGVVAGHDAAGAGRYADGDQSVDQLPGKGFDLLHLFSRKVVGVDDGIVLVGREGLLPPTFAAQDDEGETVGQVGKTIGTQEGNQAKLELIVEVGDHPHQFRGRYPRPGQVHDQTLNARMDFLQVFQGLRFFDIPEHLLGRAGLQSNDVRIGDDTREPPG
jgi:hypothetical protein